MEPHISNHGLGHTDSGYSKYQVPTWLTVPPSLYSQRTKKVKKKKIKTFKTSIVQGWEIVLLVKCWLWNHEK